MQLLLRLAGVEGVEWKDWETEKTAPEGPFPLPTCLCSLPRRRHHRDLGADLHLR